MTDEVIDVSGANVVEFIPPGDAIEPISGIPLIDADAKVVARLLRMRAWTIKARFFDNAVADSLNSIVNLASATGDDSRGERVACALSEMMRRIGEVLELLGLSSPPNMAAAGLFLLSLNPAHRGAGEEWVRDQRKWRNTRHFIDDAVEGATNFLPCSTAPSKCRFRCTASCGTPARCTAARSMGRVSNDPGR